MAAFSLRVVAHALILRMTMISLRVAPHSSAQLRSALADRPEKYSPRTSVKAAPCIYYLPLTNFILHCIVPSQELKSNFTGLTIAAVHGQGLDGRCCLRLQTLPTNIPTLRFGLSGSHHRSYNCVRFVNQKTQPLVLIHIILMHVVCVAYSSVNMHAKKAVSATSSPK